MILAAGRGSRLGSLTESTPKILQVYRGRTLLEWHIFHIREAGFLSKINVIGGFMSQRLSDFPINLIVNNDWERANIGSSLMAADQILSQGDTLVIYGDIYYESHLITQMLDLPAPVVASVENWFEIWNQRLPEPIEDLESFKVDPEGKLVEIGNKVKHLSEIQGQFSGVFSLNAEAWEKIRFLPDLVNSDCTTLLNRAIESGIVLNVLKYNSMWKEFDLPSDFRE